MHNAEYHAGFVASLRVCFMILREIRGAFAAKLARRGCRGCNGGSGNCHNGPALGGTSFQKMGLFEPYKTNNSAEGRAGVTGKDEDRMNFKVPTLRNVELTYPYFHDGEAETLEEAVDLMGRLQLGRKYTEQEVSDLVAFLKTLTGDQPTFVMPLLPPSSNETPKPKPWQ